VNQVLEHILRRAEVPQAELFTTDEVAQWRKGAIDWLMAVGILREAEPAEEVLCDECEEGCWIKPTIQEDPQTHQHFGSYFCHRNEDIGPFKVDLSRRRRWKFSLVGLAKAISKAVKPTGKVTELAPERLAMLGTVKLDGKVRELFLARGAAWPDAAEVFGNCSRLKMASHPAVLTLVAMPKAPLLAGCELAVRPLAEIANVHKGKLTMTLDAAFPEAEPGPWADLANEPITLDEFMKRYCEQRTAQLRRSRRKALLHAAWHGTVRMPPLACPYESGKSNKYFVHDLLNAWQGYQDENLDLPPLLLPQYK
jgi:hypothetical protein